jgi:hypothetical protein
MIDTSEQVRKSKERTQLEKLLRMLRSMSRRFPQPKLERTLDGFGVSLADGRWMRIRLTGNWSAEDTRDFLALFATWLTVDAEYLRSGATPLAGYSAEVIGPSH